MSGAAAGVLLCGCAAARTKDHSSPSAQATSHPAPTHTDHGSVVQNAPTTAPPAGKPPRTVVEIGHGPRSLPRVALTFHGAGDPTTAEALLRAAEHAGTPVTVLAVGTWLAQNPGMAGRIRRGGHELGNHTLNHLPMRQLDESRAYDEIAGCAAVLHRLTGSTGRWFRASGTQYTTPLIRAAAARAGYRSCLSYDVDTRDYLDPGAATVIRNGVELARPGSILSLHLGHPGTVRALPALVGGLRARGLRPVTVTELLR
ncbi:Peptidoglycan/xylan/chitin deacetylase, PgdA/CDA1 family [Actinopolymorpha singaporensis]|uniref:Peptidoglycan/xylan/chitin deacetylase, PgdA/CDA1 family n=1 Tax=Actinopolymorpha singaporensis TaxID=117157 RepID=A0A1H1UVD8_9ACTN|nr:Peptidoglycan/xylan/chitin deacetylase, PgdA/CDA1 family [Actinopolymorpha singaporensis]